MAEELNALGQVAGGREGSGLAQILGTGSFNPAMFAAIPKQAYEQQQAKKAKNYEAGVKDIADLKPEGLNEDIIKEVVPAINETKKMFSDFWAKGVDPTDPRNVDAYIAFQKQKSATQGLLEAAKQKKDLYTKAYDIQANNADDTKFDRLESQKMLNQYYSTPLKDVEKLKQMQNEGLLVPAYNFEKHTRDELFKGVPYLAAEITNPVDIGGGMMRANKVEKVNLKDIENRTSKVLQNPTTFKERKFNEELDRLVNSAQPLVDPTKNEIVGFTTGNETYDKAIVEARAAKGFDKLSPKDQFFEMKKAVAIGIAKEMYPDKKEADFKYPSKTNINVNVGGGDPNSGDLIPTFISNRVKEVQSEIINNPGKYTIDQQWDMIKQKVGGTILKNKEGDVTGIRLINPANMGRVFITASKNQILSQQNGKFRPTKGTGTIPGEYVATDWVYKDKNGVTTTPNNPDAITYFQIEMKPIRATTDSEIDKAMSQFILSDPNASSITKEAFKKMLKNSEDIEGTYKIEYRADDPVGQAQVAELVYGSSVVSNVLLNKAKGSNDPKPQPQNNSKKTVIKGLFNND
jgi:hypothetical protein